MRLALTIVTGMCSAAAADSFVPDRAVVVGRVDTGAWSDAATEPRADQKAELAAVVVGHRGRKRVVLAPEAITKVRIAGSSMVTEKLEGAKIQWSTVEPHGFRTSPSKNGITTEWYSNVSQEPGSHGKWMGWDHIDYFERVVAPWGAASTITAAVTSGELHAQQLPGLGTVRYKVEVEVAGVTVASPGSGATDTSGLVPAVHRVSIRRGDDFLGRLSGYMLVPEVFGSAGGGAMHQTERFTGADCADVMVGAARRMGRSLAYTNVAGLPAYARTIAGSVELDDHGTPAKPVIGVKAGDLIRIDYGARATRAGWDHVAALWEDRSDPNGPHKGGPDGQLDGFDLVIHMGHPRLVIEALSEQAPATIDVLRWR
ncbi:MAG: hypothetical protein ABI867_17460 [Kofleriaceae bacterium]